MRLRVGRLATLRVDFGDDENGGQAAGVHLLVHAGHEAGPDSTNPVADIQAVGDGRTFTADWTPPGMGLFTGIWQATGGIYRRFYFEVTEAPIVAVSEVRAFDEAISDSTRFPAALVAAVRDAVEEEFEKITDRSFVIRSRRGFFIDAYREENDTRRILDNPDGSVTIEYGLYPAPPDVRRAALIRIRDVLLSDNSAIPDRAVSFQVSEMGTYQLATAGRAGFETGIPDVDATLARYTLDWWML
ncbi:hypothetical protein [Kitasatospora sp. MBT66]|uniref:hypothetical protein n=1 Tax=Kitasatospora sp. MBT66 TaxID=1444769 RepID=UPI0005B78F0A|nr:hypothetical protein [Kitasatospora sp. MBT66]